MFAIITKKVYYYCITMNFGDHFALSVRCLTEVSVNFPEAFF